jgi:cell division inhibitor SepF
MPNWLDSAREFLGLGHDPYYDELDDDQAGYEDGTDDEPSARPQGARSMPSTYPAEASPDNEEDTGVRVIAAGDSDRSHRPGTTSSEASGTRDRAVVRPIPTTAKPDVVTPTQFDDSRLVADAVKRIQPVILNLQGVDRELSRRLIDFASGLCYGLEVDMERVARQVFLLTPKGADVSADDRKRLEEGHLSEYTD